MKKFLKGIASIIIVVLIAATILYSRQFFIESIKKDSILTSTEELATYITKELASGNQKHTLYLKYITEDELLNINDYVDGFFGTVNSYKILAKYNKYLYKVEINYQLSDNYYVYRAYKFNEDIPSENLTAKELHEKVISIIDSIINTTMTDYEKEIAIHDYIIKNCEYAFIDGDMEPYSYRAYGTLVKNKSVCNGYAEAMQLLLMCVDIESKIITGYADEVSHAWNLVNIEGDWYHVDTTWDDPIPDQAEKVSYVYFNLSDEVIGENHTWNEKAYPPCESLNENYYVRENGIFKSFAEYKSYVLATLDKESPEIISAMVENADISSFDFIFTSTKVSNISYVANEVGKYTVIEITLMYH